MSFNTARMKSIALKPKTKTQHKAATRLEKAPPAPKDPDAFVEDLDDPDDDYERGVEEVVRKTHAELEPG